MTTMTKQTVSPLQIQKFEQLNQAAENHVKKSYDFSRDGESGGGSQDLYWSEETRTFPSPSTLKSLFFSEDWVFILTNLVANKISSQRMVVKRNETDDDGQVTTTMVDDHPALTLLDQPNPWQDYHAYMYNDIVEDVLMGNAIIWYAKRNNHLIILPSDQVTMRFDDKGELLFYEMTSQSQDQSVLNETGNMQFKPSEILHIRRPNPASLWWGLSPFIPGNKAVLFNRYTSDYLNAFYLKQATPSMILSMERTVNEDLAIRQLASMEMAYSGRANQRRTMMLPKGVKAETVNQPIADQKLTDITIQNRETMMNLLSVPKQEISMQESGSLGSEEYRIALRNFWNAQLIPTMRRNGGAYTRFFRSFGLLADNESLDYDVDGIEALQDDLMKKAEIAIAMAQTLPLNKVIERVWEEEPIADPRAELPLSLPPIEEVQNEPKDETENAPDESNQQESDDDDDDQGNKSFALEYISKHQDWFRTHVKQMDDAVEKTGSIIVERSLDLLSDMAGAAVKVVADELQETKPEKSMDVESKKAKIPSRTELIKRLQKIFSTFEEEFVTENATTLTSTMELGYDSQLLSVTFNATDRDQIDALRIRDGGEGKRHAILTARGLETFAHVSDTQTKLIMREVTKGVVAKENIADITKRIADTFRDGQKNLARAERIARTETLTASSIGQDFAYRNAEEVIPGIERMWLNAGDERVRGNPDGIYAKAKDDHWDLQGDRVKKNETFKNGLRFPRDPESDDPAKVINCRCTTTLILPPKNI